MQTAAATPTSTDPPPKAPAYKWGVSLVMVAVISLGWKYPLLGFVVPVAMMAGILGGFYRGRWVCGNLCPRGSFFDTWFRPVAGEQKIPPLLKKGWLRWTVLAALISFMTFRLAQNPSDPDHWGSVFWQMCLFTTLIAVILGRRYSARSWCSFCPIGTLGSSIGGDWHLLQIKSTCKGCGLCRQSCPMQIEIPQYRGEGIVRNRDCLKCSACIQACPRSDVLAWPGKAA